MSRFLRIIFCSPGYPTDDAAQLVAQTIREYLEQNNDKVPHLKRVEQLRITNSDFPPQVRSHYFLPFSRSQRQSLRVILELLFSGRGYKRASNLITERNTSDDDENA